ncbi:YcxB family protein [Sporolactobacillus shoreae]|uniref:YcxB family protein n=1 Tax=Sporolactobacillus shoreae TaxID=1465501 RepID=A0A4Z0GNM4_9BACL|nr:YcxB family protein [Sporolactobacillus shoreae]TGA97796.1 YcxB family protein [Sporolactobacillus shoreae]
MENNDINFIGKLTFKEYRQARSHKMRMIDWIATLLILILGFLIYAKNTPLIASVIISLFYTLVFVVLLQMMLWIIYRIQFKTDPILRNERCFSVQKDGLHVSTKNSEVFYGWDGLRSACDYKNIYLLYVSALRMIMIPKRFFDKEEEIEAFECLLSAHISSEKIKLNK